MGKKVIKFKTSVIGGFDRKDVIAYIKKLADERNELRAQLNKQQASEEQRLREVYERHSSEFDGAEEILRELEIKHGEIGGQINDMREHLKSMRELAATE